MAGTNTYRLQYLMLTDMQYHVTSIELFVFLMCFFYKQQCACQSTSSWMNLMWQWQMEKILPMEKSADKEIRL